MRDRALWLASSIPNRGIEPISNETGRLCNPLTPRNPGWFTGVMSTLPSPTLLEVPREHDRVRIGPFSSDSASLCSNPSPPSGLFNKLVILFGAIRAFSLL
jgi:hypothetical protein